ncbi:MAG: hypothetical protein U0935_19875 [Pirellulales bacterium]
MPIDVTCPGCKTRFQVSDKFAGKKGPCPKCKTVIQVPEKSQEVVVHAPEQSGPKDSKGRAVLKPLTRQETRFTPLRIGILVGSIVLVLGGAITLRVMHPPKKVELRPAQNGRPAVTVSERNVPVLWLALGAVALAPALSWSGYTFLRDDELAPLTGRELWIRVLICSIVYAGLWGAYYGLKISPLVELRHEETPEPLVMVFAVLPMLVVGGGVGFGSLNLTYATGTVHYGFYLAVTVLLRLVIGLGPL